MQKGKQVSVNKAQSTTQPPRPISPEGLRVLVVDDDPSSLSVVEEKLTSCKYEVTTCQRASLALSILLEKKQKFDLILMDVHMPEMDGIKLLEIAGLELKLPVVIMSAERDVKVAARGLERGACYCLMKPFCLNELRNIWQHVVRWKRVLRKGSDYHEGSVELDGEHNRETVEEEEVSQAKRKKEDKEQDDEEEEEEEEDGPDSAYKKPRMVWSEELHGLFLKAIEELGFDNAVPKKILELMNVPGLTRENVASHLQKFRLYIRRLNAADQPLPPISSSSFSSGVIAPNFFSSTFKDQMSPAKASDRCNPMMPQPQWVGKAGHMESISSPMFMPSINSTHSYHDLQQEREGHFVSYAMPSNQMETDCNGSTQWELFSNGQNGDQQSNYLWSIGDVGSFGGSTSNPIGKYTGFMMTSTGDLHGLTLSGSSVEPSNIIDSRNNQMGHEISLGTGVTETNMKGLSNPYFGTFDCGYSNQETAYDTTGRFADPTQQQTDLQEEADADGLLSYLLQGLPFDEENDGDRSGKQ